MQDLSARRSRGTGLKDIEDAEENQPDSHPRSANRVSAASDSEMVLRCESDPAVRCLKPPDNQDHHGAQGHVQPVGKTREGHKRCWA